MSNFDWDELDRSVSEWKNLYNFLMTNVDEKGFNIKAALYTTVQVEPHVYDKCQITNIKKVKCYLLENYLKKNMMCLYTGHLNSRLMEKSGILL